MRKLTLSIVLLTIMVSLVACGGNKGNQNETKPTLEVIEPTETTEAETLSDKLDETKTYKIPGSVVIDEEGNAVVEPETVRESVSEEEIKEAQEAFKDAPLSLDVEDKENKSSAEIQEEIDKQLKERMATVTDENDTTTETSSLSGDNQETQSSSETQAVSETNGTSETIAYTDEQAALDALNEYNMQYVREGYIPMIRGLIEDKQAKGIHDYDHITYEEIAGYTDEQAQNLIVELLR